MFVFEQQIKNEYRRVLRGDMVVFRFEGEDDSMIATVLELIDSKTIACGFDDGTTANIHVMDIHDGRILDWELRSDIMVRRIVDVRRGSGESLFVTDGAFVSYTAMPILSKIKVGTVIDLLFTHKTARLVQLTDHGAVFELSNGHIGVMDVADPSFIHFPTINRKYIPFVNIVNSDEVCDVL